jgi:glutamate 5-kinase
VPVINENDSISTEEIKCGDNDRLSFLVSDLAAADMLIILTDVDGVYDGDGDLVKEIDEVTDDIRALCKGKGCNVSTGGMTTKIEAAKCAMLSGIECVIAKGKQANVILDIVEGKAIGTRFSAQDNPITARKRWIAYSIKAKGSIIVDHGAEKAIVGGKKSLLPSGIVDFTGRFDEGDVIDIVSEDGKTIGRGLSNYSSAEIVQIKGKKSDMIEDILGYKDYDEVIHRDNLVVNS